MELTGERSVSPPPLYGRHLYSEATIRWWEVWCGSPQAEAFLATDWQRLVMLAPIVDLYFETADKNLLAEIRLNEERLGATIRDRQSLRMQIKARDDGGQEESKPARDPENVVRLRKAFEGP